MVRKNYAFLYWGNSPKHPKDQFDPLPKQVSGFFISGDKYEIITFKRDVFRDIYD